MKDTLLIELLTEELPPKALSRLSDVFAAEVYAGLEKRKLVSTESVATAFATPRRLAVQVTEVLLQAPDFRLEKKIMPVTVALDAEGKPTPTLLKKLASMGVLPDSIASFERRMDGKSETFFYADMAKGETLFGCMDSIVEDAIGKLPIPKLMRWGDSEHQFVRPVHGLLMLHGNSEVPGKVLGLESKKITRGHRFLGAGDIAISHAKDYAAVLAEKGRVIASFDERRDLIRSQLDKVAGDRQWLQDEALLDEVTALVEFPVVYEAGFDEEFLAVPQECLILTMKANQKYFPLLRDGKLTNRFLLVSNMQVADPVHIIGGNERVVRPRLSDARFFFNQDRKSALATRLPRLDSIVYHNKLGSVGERVRRMAKLAEAIAARLGADKIHAARGALLAKADLVTDMVGEFPELQGIMGRYYARHDKEPEDVADAIEGHYHPRFNGDTLPAGNVACAVALADKLDALVGFFGIGQLPTGDKDPFGLRRATLGALRILMETPLPLDISELIDDAAAGFATGLLSGSYKTQLFEFMQERLRGMLREQGNEPKLVDAVLALNPTRIDKVPAKLAAAKDFVALPEAEALAAANKRIINILKKAEGAAIDVDVALLQESAEKALFERVTAITPTVRSFVANEDYADALKALAGLRAEVDAFFDSVMVMAEEPLTRANRLALLRQLAGLMNQVADISKLSA